MISLINDYIYRLFKPSNQPILFNFVSVFSLRALQMGLSFATAYFLVRALSKEQFGEYHYVLGWIGVLTIFALPGLTDSVMQAMSRKRYGTYFRALKLAFASSTLGSVILLGCVGWFAFHGDKEMAAGFCVAALLFPFLHGLTMWKSVRQGKEDFKKLLTVEGTNSLVMSVLLIVSLLFFPKNIFVPLIIVMGVPALMNIWQSYAHYRSIPPDAEIEDGNIAFGVKTSVYSIFSVLGNHIDKLLLYGFLTPEALAVYMAAQKLTEPVQGITQDLAAILAPRFAQYTHLTKALDHAIIIFCAVMGVGIVIFSFTLLPPLFMVIFGEKYADSIPYCQALMCSLIFGNVASLRFRFIRSRMSLTSVRNITFGNSTFKIAASLILIPFFGITGAVVSNILTKIALNVQIYFDIKRFRMVDQEM